MTAEDRRKLNRQLRTIRGAKARVAKKLNVHPGQVSKVLSGDRDNLAILNALMDEVEAAKPKLEERDKTLERLRSLTQTP